MEVIRIGEFNTKALEETVVIQPVEHAMYMANNPINNHACLKRLEYLLEFLSKDPNVSCAKFAEHLASKLQQFVKEDFFDIAESFLEETLKETRHLRKHLDLAKVTLSLNLQILKMAKNSKWKTENIEVKQGDYIRSYLVPNYYFLEALVEFIGREAAIRIFKNYLSVFLATQINYSTYNFTSLKDTFEKRKNAANTNSDWVMIIGYTNEGKYVYRNDNCLWVDALQDLPDKEIKYYICCYGDYQIANSVANGQVILTMEHTLAEGDSYCSRAKHDTRKDWNLNHPSKDFFDKLWPITK